MALQPSLLGTIAMETFGAQSLNDLSFSIKTQTRSVLESHAPPPGPDGTLFGFGRAVQSEGKAPKVPSGGDTVAREGLASSGR
jgi:hypothetical protein